MDYPHLKFSLVLDRTESGFKRLPSLLTQYSQNKIISLYREANLTLHWTGAVFVSIVSAHSDLFSVNVDPEKTNGLERNPSPRNRSQVLSTLESSVGLTFNYRNYSGITPQMFHQKSSFLFLFCFTHFQQLFHVKTHLLALHFWFLFSDNYSSLGNYLIFFFFFLFFIFSLDRYSPTS